MERLSFTTEQIQKAKSYPIMELLSQNGYEPIKHTAKGCLFYSPFRNETEPSFFVDKQNGFYDFGAGIGGDVIRLLCKLQNISFVEAVKKLLENQDFFFVSPETCKEKRDNLHLTEGIKSIKPLHGNFFKNYIESRKISFEIAKQYLQVIYYKLRPEQGKCYFGVGMQNVLNGYEIKNIQKDKYFCLGAKAPTMIDQERPEHWSVFEGMFDFLACLTYYQKPIQTNVLILHSASQARKSLDFLQGAKKVFLFLDNDTAGNQATEIFMSLGGACVVKDCRNIYKNYKDFNEFLKGNFEH
ncbi:MAG: toprim domain-containing protein [Raineya sp.]